MWYDLYIACNIIIYPIWWLLITWCLLGARTSAATGVVYYYYYCYCYCYCYCHCHCHCHYHYHYHYLVPGHLQPPCWHGPVVTHHPNSIVQVFNSQRHPLSLQVSVMVCSLEKIVDIEIKKMPISHPWDVYHEYHWKIPQFEFIKKYSISQSDLWAMGCLLLVFWSKLICYNETLLYYAPLWAVICIS